MPETAPHPAIAPRPQSVPAGQSDESVPRNDLPVAPPTRVAPRPAAVGFPL